MMAVFKQAEVLLMLAFVAALVLYFTLKLWLNMRQIRFIMAHQHQVPPPFDCHIDLEAHQKSARYAFVKLRLARLGLFISTSVLLIWTLGGGIASLSAVVQHLTAHPLHFGVVLLVLFSLIGSLFELPLAYVDQFYVEQSFGFNRMTRGMWWMDLLKNTVLSAVLGAVLAKRLLPVLKTGR